MSEIKYLNNITLNGNEIREVSLEKRSTQPGLPVNHTGQVYYNTTEKQAFYSNGTAWVAMDASAAAASLTSGKLINIINTNNPEGTDTTLSVTKGGTGVDASSTTAGQLLIGKTSGGFSLSALSLSSPLKIVNGSGTIDLSHLNTDGNKHVPATGTSNGGKVLTAGTTAGALTWETPSVAWGNVSNKPTSSVGNIDDAVSKRHVQNTDTGTTEENFIINSASTPNGVTLATGSTGLSIKNKEGNALVDLIAKKVTSESFNIKSESYINEIKTTALTANSSLTLANGNTVLVAGTMVPTARTIKIATSNGIAGGSSTANDLSINRTWGLSLTGQARAFHELSTDGIVVKTGVDTVTTRTIVGATGKIDIVNGAGFSGNPIIDIASSYVGQTSITTLGTIGTGTWEGSTIGVGYGGTGLATTPTDGKLLIGNGTGYALANIIGITNRVTVINSPGGITLTTPQDLHTEAAIRFARMGLGTAADATANLKLSSGTIISEVANATSATGFTLSTPSYDTTGADLFKLVNGSLTKFSVDKDGLVVLKNIKVEGLSPDQNELVKFNSNGTLDRSGIDASDFATGGRYAVFDRDTHTTVTSPKTIIPFDLNVFNSITDSLIVYENLVYYLVEGEDYTINSTNDGITLTVAKPVGTRYDFLAIKNVPEDGHTYSGIYITDGSITNAKLASDIKIGSLATLKNSFISPPSTPIDISSIDSIEDAILYVHTNAASLSNSLTLNFGTGSTEGTDTYEFNGSESKTIAINSGTGLALTKSVGSVSIGIDTTTMAKINLSHQQNTDKGTTNNSFRINSSNTSGTAGGILIKHSESSLHLRNSTDTDYADLRVKDLFVEGKLTTVSSNDVNIGDSIITLNSDLTSDLPNADGGVEVKLFKANDTETSAKMIFNSSLGVWQATFGDVENLITQTVTTKYSSLIGDGTQTVFTLTHNMNTRDLSVTVRENASPYSVVYTDVEFPSINTVKISFGSAPGSNAYRVTVIG